MDQKELNQLKQKYGEIYEVQYGEQTFYFKKPSRPEYKRYYDKLLDSVYDATCILIFDLIVVPSRDEMLAFLERDPTFPVKIIGRLTDFFGSTITKLQKI